MSQENHETANFKIHILITAYEDKMGYISFESKTDPTHRGHFECIGENHQCFRRMSGKVPNEVAAYLRSIGFTIPKTFNKASYYYDREAGIANKLERELKRFRSLHGEGRDVNITFYNGIDEALGKAFKITPYKEVVFVSTINNTPRAAGSHILKSGKLSQWFRKHINEALKETNWFVISDFTDPSIKTASL